MSRTRALFVVAALATVACGSFRSTEQSPPEDGTTTRSPDPTESPSAKKEKAPGSAPESPQTQTTTPSTATPEKSVSVLPESEDDCAPLMPVACQSCCATLAGLKAAKGEDFNKSVSACIDEVCE